MGFCAVDDNVDAVRYRANGAVKVVEMKTKSPRSLEDVYALEKQISKEYEDYSDVYILSLRQRSWSTLKPEEPASFDYWYPVNRDVSDD